MRARNVEAEERRARMLKEKTRRNKKYGQAPARGMGKLKCEICGKPLSKHDIMKLCTGV